MRLALLISLLAASAASAQGTGTLAGTVLETDGVTAVIGANVRVEGTTLGAATDLDGNYRINGVPWGTYTVTAHYAGYPSQAISDVEVTPGYTRVLDFALSTPLLEDYGCCCYESPIITNDAIGYARLLVGADLENMPVNR